MTKTEEMKKILDCTTPQSHYTASACIVWCFDDRFTHALQKFTTQNGFGGNYDLIKIAGGALTLSNQHNSDSGFVLRQIRTSLQLHHAERIILMMHTDCGACGGSKAFAADPESETQFLLTTLKRAKENVQKVFEGTSNANVPIETILVDFTGVWQVDYYPM